MISFVSDWALDGLHEKFFLRGFHSRGPCRLGLSGARAPLWVWFPLGARLHHIAAWGPLAQLCILAPESRLLNCVLRVQYYAAK